MKNKIAMSSWRATLRAIEYAKKADKRTKKTFYNFYTGKPVATVYRGRVSYC